MSRSLGAARWLAAGLVVAAITGCVADTLPEACDEPSITLELELTIDSLTPGAPAVCRDQRVSLVIASTVDGVVHIHGYDAVVPASAVNAGEELRLSFIAERSGQFPIELHPADDPIGVSIGVFTVHEP